jgi:hypothetical protein
MLEDQIREIETGALARIEAAHSPENLEAVRDLAPPDRARAEAA